jgi:hypothetical protein
MNVSCINIQCRPTPQICEAEAAAPAGDTILDDQGNAVLDDQGAEIHYD